MPVVRLDGSTIGDGRPGPIAGQLQAKLLASIEASERAVR
jgi:hypothetical protein